MADNDLLWQSYSRAKSRVRSAGFKYEEIWQASRNCNRITETCFLRESAWVVLCSGFREKVVRNMFSYISLCFCDWESALAIVERKEVCKKTALAKFSNVSKIEAITNIAEIVTEIGFDNYKHQLLNNPLQELKKLPYIGPITVYHLAKNLGLPVAKPDRHLQRLADACGFSDVQAFCSNISYISGDSISVVDIILWRFATIEKNYLEFFANCYL